MLSRLVKRLFVRKAKPSAENGDPESPRWTLNYKTPRTIVSELLDSGQSAEVYASLRQPANPVDGVFSAECNRFPGINRQTQIKPGPEPLEQEPKIEDAVAEAPGEISDTEEIIAKPASLSAACVKTTSLPETNKVTAPLEPVETVVGGPKLTKVERDARWERRIRIRDRRESRIISRDYSPQQAVYTYTQTPSLPEKTEAGSLKVIKTVIEKPKLTKEQKDARWQRKIRARDRREARVLYENCVSQSGMN